MSPPRHGHHGLPEWREPLHYLAVHGLNILLGAGGAATAVGVIYGGVLAFLYGRRGSAVISAEAHNTWTGFVLAARPILKAVGIFRVEFPERGSATVRVIELHLTTSGDIKEGRFWEHPAVFGHQFVEAGEELPTTVLFNLADPPSSVVGWTVFFTAEAPTRFRRLRSGSWADQIFVPRPMDDRQGSLSARRSVDDSRPEAGAQRADRRKCADWFWLVEAVGRRARGTRSQSRPKPASRRRGSI
jgi:hypothetical protein